MDTEGLCHGTINDIRASLVLVNVLWIHREVQSHAPQTGNNIDRVGKIWYSSPILRSDLRRIVEKAADASVCSNLISS